MTPCERMFPRRIMIFPIFVTKITQKYTKGMMMTNAQGVRKPLIMILSRDFISIGFAYTSAPILRSEMKIMKVITPIIINEKIEKIKPAVRKVSSLIVFINNTTIGMANIMKFSFDPTHTMMDKNKGIQK